MDSVSEADMVVVLDTGSTDNTAERLRARGAKVYTQVISPWRFDTARNISMDHIPEDIDICVSNDLDEVFEKGWRQRLEQVWKPYHTRAKYLFTCSYNADGTPNKQHSMEKIHRRHGFRWVHPVHEVLEYTGDDKDQTVWVPGLVLNHYPDLSKPRAQYLPLLELSAQENSNNDRIAFWLGREYMYYGKNEQCIQTLSRYLTMKTAVWEEERSAAMRFIAKAYQAKKDFTQARSWLFRAIAECPNVREPYLQLARLGYLESDWPLVHLATDMALRITQKTGSYLFEPETWGYVLYDLAAIACYRLGLYEKSQNFARQAYEMNTNDQRLKDNLDIITRALGEQNAKL